MLSRILFRNNLICRSRNFCTNQERTEKIWRDQAREIDIDLKIDNKISKNNQDVAALFNTMKDSEKELNYEISKLSIRISIHVTIIYSMLFCMFIKK